MIDQAEFFILYLFYGLVFFVMGVAIMSREMRFSRLKVARVFWLFALFALIHGCNEWLVMFIGLNRPVISTDFLNYLLLAKAIMLNLSFACLLWFGLELFLFEKPGPLVWSFLVMLVLFLTFGPFAAVIMNPDYHLFALRIRYFVGLPASVLAGIGFINYSKTVASLSASGARNFTRAGYALLVYGVFAGLFPSGTVFIFVPVELCRGLSALLILHFVMRGLQVFGVEHHNLIEERLKRFSQSEKMNSLGKLSSGVAHEINNPLTNALMNVELMEKDLKGWHRFDNGLDKRFQVIKSNIGRASKIAGELLFFSREGESELMPLSLCELVQSTFELIGNRRNHFDFQVQMEKVPDINGIPWKLEEVILNVLMNAMDAVTEPNNKIDVRVGMVDQWVCCSIGDKGPGIKAEHLDKIFDPFFTTKEPGKGTGLGLSICFGIMQLHGGELRVDSSPGKGTIVQLLFPVANEEEE